MQRIGTWVVKQLSGSSILDATTGFRAYDREAALRLNITSEYTYTLESIIQAENKNLVIENILISTNVVTRKSRLFKSMWEYIKKSIIALLRIYSTFNPLNIFLSIGVAIMGIGFVLVLRFLAYYFIGLGEGKIQSLILAAVLLIIGFQTAIIGLLADLISTNRKLIEEILLKVKRIELRFKRKF